MWSVTVYLAESYKVETTDLDENILKWSKYDLGANFSSLFANILT